jgi:GT2 family glycosyltransferase
LVSAQRQSFDDIEIVVADDGSTDPSVEVIVRVADGRVRLLRLPHAGPAAALNRAIASTRGQFVAFLDGDDVWNEDKLARQVAFMEAHPEADLTFALSRTIDENGRGLGLISRGWHGPVPFERLLVDNVITSGSAVLVRREALLAAGPFDEALAAAHDHDMWLKIAARRVGNVLCVPEVLQSYRRRSGQITRDWRLMEASMRQVFARHRASCGTNAASMEREAQCNLYRYLAVLNYEAGRIGKGGELMGRSFLASPYAFVRARRSYLVTGALCARAVLPVWLCRTLERVLRGC